jgi:hypothetical protein
MRLNINQKLVLILNFLEFTKSVYPTNEPLPEMLQERARKVMQWLDTNAITEARDSKAGIAIVGEHNLPPPGPGEEYGSVIIGSLELGDAIFQVMEAVVAAELSPDRIADPPPPRRVRKGRVETFAPRRGRRR